LRAERVFCYFPHFMALALKPENIVQLVFFVRGEKVMFDADLAKLYGVSTKALNQAFRRNKQRFPSDFAFKLSSAEYDNLKSQIVTSSAGEIISITILETEMLLRVVVEETDTEPTVVTLYKTSKFAKYEGGA
jgi:ORF6N domain-containing protein